MREPTPDDSKAPIDPADLERGKREGELLCDMFQQARARSVSTFDQLLAQLRDLARPMEMVAGSMSLPSGLRIELIKALSTMLSNVICTMDEEEDPPPGRPSAHAETVDLITSVLVHAEESRFQNRVCSVAATLGEDEDWEAYDRITSDPRLLEAFARKAGRNPSAATIRAWLEKTVRTRPPS
jgi:hypothetical protein